MKLLLIAIMLLLASVISTSAAQPSGYVLFHRVLGQWMVTCDRDMVSGEVGCRASTPPAQLAGGGMRLAVAETADSDYVVSARMASWADLSHPVALGVDGLPPLVARPLSPGEARWQGQDAQKLVADMAAGRRAVLVSHSRDGRPIAETLPLDGLAEALAAMRGLLKP